MEAMSRIDQALAASIEPALAQVLERSRSEDAPARLQAAMRYAVFPGGARLRPRLCMAVAHSCAADETAVVDAAACAIELLHCASLVHDDMPCFDDAETRRGKPSVHRAYGEKVALLTGDALIVLAFQALALGTQVAPQRLAPLVMIISRAVGMPRGIVAGQARECEPQADLGQYHLQKTGALFAAAAMAGAAAAGAESTPWHALGEKLGQAYQVADDIRDVAATAEETGKPIGQDIRHGRPSAALELGLPGAIARLDLLVEEAVASIPACPGGAGLRALIQIEARRFLPESLTRLAA